MRPVILSTLCLLALVPALAAQNEAALRAGLEGKSVTIKVDMPATAQGIDVYPEDGMPVDWRRVADRIKENGTSVRTGQSIMITKVAVKGNSHIEVQLGGGGFGTFWDNMGSGSNVTATQETESGRERAIKDSLRRTLPASERRRLERELNSARTARERENARARADAEQANRAREANLRSQRAESGSRFNVRFRQGIPASALTPEGLLAALAQYAEPVGGAVAAPTTSATAAAAATAQTVRPQPAGANAMLSLRKGLTIAEVDALLGPARTASESKEGGLTTMTRTYVVDGKRITASFVNDVLVDYAIAPT